MKPHPRIRKTVKWGGVVACVLLTIGLFISGIGQAGYRVTDGSVLSVGGGQVIVLRHKSSPQTDQYSSTGAWQRGRVIAYPSYRLKWWFHHQQASGFEFHLIPIWVVIVPIVIGTAAAWRLDTLARRRARVGLCPKCHYDRAGLAPGAVCPECGAAPLPPAP